MNETLEVMPQTVPEEKFRPKAEALTLIYDSDIPTELKQHFADIIQILGNKTELKNRERSGQIYDIAEELNMAKRNYLDAQELEEDPGANELIHEIVQVYMKV